MKHKILKKFLTIFLCMGALAGCVDTRNWMEPEAVIFEEGWTKRPAEYQPAPLYCYETLGRTDCYPAPQKFTGQLKASYPPPKPRGIFPKGGPESFIPTAAKENLFSTWPLGAQ
ncbi:MAG: hypothetical protein GY915_08010 [bacterium]|nr:hypothetical protein [bacterium]